MPEPGHPSGQQNDSDDSMGSGYRSLLSGSFADAAGVPALPIVPSVFASRALLQCPGNPYFSLLLRHMEQTPAKVETSSLPFQAMTNIHAAVLSGHGLHWKRLAAGAGLTTPGAGRVYQNTYQQQATLCYMCSRMFLAALFKKVAEAISGPWHGVLFNTSSCSDEASRALRVRMPCAKQEGAPATSSESAPASSATVAVPNGKPPGPAEKASTQNARVLYTRLRCGMLLRHQEGSYRYFIFPLCCTLQNLEALTTPCLNDAQKRQLSLPGAETCEALFHRRNVAHTQDQCSANVAQGNAAKNEDRSRAAKGGLGRSRLGLPCTVHSLATVCTKTFDLEQDSIGGTISFGITKRQPGRFDSLRRQLTEAAVRKLWIIRDQPPPGPGDEAWEHRKAWLDTVFPVHEYIDADTGHPKPGYMAVLLQRVVHERLFNGDIRSKHVEHYADPGMSDDEVIAMFRKSTAEALFPTLLPLYARHRWNGFHLPLRKATVPLGTCELLDEVMPTWCPPSLAAIALAGQSMPWTMAILPTWSRKAHQTIERCVISRLFRQQR